MSVIPHPPRVGDDHITWPKLTGKNDEVKYWGMRLLKNNSHIFMFTFCGLGFLLYVYINKQKHHIKMITTTSLKHYKKLKAMGVSVQLISKF